MNCIPVTLHKEDIRSESVYQERHLLFRKCLSLLLFRHFSLCQLNNFNNGNNAETDCNGDDKFLKGNGREAECVCEEAYFADQRRCGKRAKRREVENEVV